MTQNEIKARFTTIGQKNRTNPTNTDVYMRFQILDNGTPTTQPFKIGTGITITGAVKKGVAVGGDAKSKNNDISIAKGKIHQLVTLLNARQLSTVAEMKNEIWANAKFYMTGIQTISFKSKYLSKLQQYEYATIVTNYVEENNIEGSRRRNYLHTIDILNSVFNDNIPTIERITKDDTEKIKSVIKKKCKKHNASVTYLGMIAAIFNYAADKDLIIKSPIVKGFRGSFKRAEREVLTQDELNRIINIDDESLKETELVIKYSTLVMALSGINYVDLKGLQHTDIKYDDYNDQYYIEKGRKKSEVKFTSNLTAMAWHCFKKLKSLTGNDKAPINLPSIEYFLRIVKDLCKKVGIKKSVTTYTLRHTFAQDFMQHDGKLEDLQIRLGHTSIKTTQIYGVINQQRNAEKTRQLEQKSKIHQLPIERILEAV